MVRAGVLGPAKQVRVTGDPPCKRRMDRVQRAKPTHKACVVLSFDVWQRVFAFLGPYIAETEEECFLFFNTFHGAGRIRLRPAPGLKALNAEVPFHEMAIGPNTFVPQSAPRLEVLEVDYSVVGWNHEMYWRVCDLLQASPNLLELKTRNHVADSLGNACYALRTSWDNKRRKSLRAFSVRSTFVSLSERSLLKTALAGREPELKSISLVEEGDSVHAQSLNDLCDILEGKEGIEHVEYKLYHPRAGAEPDADQGKLRWLSTVKTLVIPNSSLCNTFVRCFSAVPQSQLVKLYLGAPRFRSPHSMKVFFRALRRYPLQELEIIPSEETTDAVLEYLHTKPGLEKLLTGSWIPSFDISSDIAKIVMYKPNPFWDYLEWHTKPLKSS